MATIPAQRITEPLAEAWQKPLSLRESLFVASALFLFGTLYCQVYCALAMQPGGMPLKISMWRSAIETIPAYIAFELAKRILRRRRGISAGVAVFTILLCSTMLSAGAILLSHALFYPAVMPPRLFIADRMPGLSLVTVAIGIASLRARANPSRKIRDEIVLPPAALIDWVQAAGNYIEVHVGGRTILLRMSLREAASVLGTRSFVQIHRSVILNKDRVAAWDPPKHPRRVRLIDGTQLAVGESYRTAIGN